MAKVSAHGFEIGTIDYIHSAKRYMSDRTILRHDGSGWKIYGKIKPEFTPREAFDRAMARFEAKMAVYPCNAEYRKELHNACGRTERWRLHLAITTMPDDPDGVWSECCDGGYGRVHCDVEEIVYLCKLYKLACREAKLETE